MVGQQKVGLFERGEKPRVAVDTDVVNKDLEVTIWVRKVFGSIGLLESYGNYMHLRVSLIIALETLHTSCDSTLTVWFCFEQLGWGFVCF